MNKSAAVIASCQNSDQLRVANRYCNLAADRITSANLIARLSSMLGYMAGRIELKKEIENG